MIIIIIMLHPWAWFKERATRHACRLTNTVALVKALQRAKAWYQQQHRKSWKSGAKRAAANGSNTDQCWKTQAGVQNITSTQLTCKSINFKNCTTANNMSSSKQKTLRPTWHQMSAGATQSQSKLGVSYSRPRSFWFSPQRILPGLLDQQCNR